MYDLIKQKFENGRKFVNLEVEASVKAKEASLAKIIEKCDNSLGVVKSDISLAQSAAQPKKSGVNYNLELCKKLKSEKKKDKY